jgi:starch phosphorylase
MRYWADKQLVSWFQEHEEYQIIGRKKHLKRLLFEEVADQTGKIFDPDILTIVWARRFAEYKRPWLLTYDMQRFKKLVNDTKRPVQIIWAGKPYPLDYRAVNMFNELIKIAKEYKNVAVLIGYELRLSKLLKLGGDIWLNTPRHSREASGTSGMSAVANACIHFSIDDGWHDEFYKDDINSFTIHHADTTLSVEEQDKKDYENMMSILEKEILPTYYDNERKWVQIIQNGMNDIRYFDSSRMVREYYEKVYKK